MIVCDLCGEARDCLQNEIEGKEYEFCSECWSPLAQKLRGKGRAINREIVLLPPPRAARGATKNLGRGASMSDSKLLRDKLLTHLAKERDLMREQPVRQKITIAPAAQTLMLFTLRVHPNKRNTQPASRLD
jgi:hypothetical protein